jgi:hypothetical protein
MRITLRYLLTLVFAAVLTISSVSVVQAMTRYEYKAIALDKVAVSNAQQLELLLNQLGTDGWSLVEIGSTGIAVFRREK